MAAAPSLDANTRAALDKLADLVVPQPVSWMPQTWGWAAVALLLLMLATWLAIRAVRRHIANRYRREALRELDGLVRRRNDGTTLTVVAALLKRVALAAWPRRDVASLSGAAWVAFLRSHSGAAQFPEAVAHLLDDAEYRGPAPGVTAGEREAFAAAAREWIEKHRVSA
jgi:hypothetical protein